MRPINKCKLTQLDVGRISPQAKTFYAWDTEQKGLCLQVRPNGYRAYKVVYQFQGRTRWFHLGAVNEISLGQARKLAQEVMYQKAQGKDPHGERRAQRSAGTLAMTATLRRTRSVANSGSRPTSLCAQRYSIATLWPST